MYLEHYHLKTSPFAEQPDPGVFFPGGQREQILEQILADLGQDSALIHLTSEEGAGKTLLCQIVRDRLRSSRDVVLLSEPAGAFDDMGRILALALGDHEAERMAGPLLYDNILLLLRERASSGRPALLIIDDAEKLFLAALERIIHLACDAQAQCSFQVLLAGRPALLANLEQIAATCAESLTQTAYTLPPLDRDTTARYLAFRLEAAGMTDSRQNGVFSAEAANKMHEATRGNIRLINILAEESLRNSCEGKSFMVLLDHVNASTGLTPAERISISRPETQHRGSKGKLTAIVALVTVVVATLFYIAFGNKKQAPLTQKTQEKPLQATGPAAPIPTLTPPTLVATPAPTPAPPPEPPPSPAPTVESAPSHVVAPPPVAVSSPAMEPLDTPAVEPAKSAAPSPRPNVPATSSVINISPASEKAAAEKAPLAQDVKKHKSIAGTKLFDERENVAKKWLTGAGQGKYTIQLMALNSATAEANIRQMLNNDEYQQTRDHLYILRKKSNPPTIFMYYGTYSSIQEARQARQQLPAAMGKFNPYPLAVSDAVKKAGP
ncbi:MAG: hypothetical protein BWK76_16360 [Desulfobulbaceae bacterium A2]|nr:MAG: hypothetical protein BWK76_16360 [Desulfobulbaceae bacterium A2]